MKHVEAKQRPMVTFLIDPAARAVGETRHLQQRIGQRIQLRLAEIGRAVSGCQFRRPEDLNPQIVAQPGEKGLIQQQSGKLTAAKTG